MRLATHFATGTLDGESAEIRSIASDNRTVARDRNVRDYRWDVAVEQADLIGRFDTGGISHTLLLGFERESTDSRTLYLRSNFRTSPYALDIYAPVYGQALPPLTIPRNNLERVTNTALYAQDQIVLSPEWKALVATRLDIFEDSFRERIPRSQADQSRVAASPRAGLIYQPIPWLSLYTNAGTSFGPTSARRRGRVAGQATEAGDGTGLRDRRQGRAVRRQPAADCGRPSGWIGRTF